MKFRIGIDLDGVLADFVTSALNNAKTILGVSIDPESVTEPHMAKFVWDRLTSGQKDLIKTVDNVYNVICPPKFFERLSAYPGAVEAVHQLYDNGYEIYFITKPLRWTDSPAEKYNWLEERFGSIKYHLMFTKKLEGKGIFNVDFMIDDDPRVLDNLYQSTIGIAIERPWNKEYVSNHQYLWTAKDMTQVVNKIKSYCAIHNNIN